MIIVTGASKGIGLAIAERMSEKGFDVIGLSRNPGNLPFRSIECDVRSFDDIKRIATLLKSEGSQLTGLVNSAGVASMNLALTTPPEVTSTLLSTNLAGTIFCCQLFGPMMLNNGGGRIINFSTIAVALGLRGESIYSASKAGVEAFSRSFAREMSGFRVTVNCIAPGPIQTEMMRGITEEQIEKVIAQQVIRDKFTTSSVADVVEILFDERAASISGQVLRVGGV